MSSHHFATTQSTHTQSARWEPDVYRPATTRETLAAYIERACDPSLAEPNMTLDLEIADLINSKKANMPREAAVQVVKLVNHRNTHVAMLGLHLLDILVKNCGYPFHLQISTKEFLNELVRRFPERPPAFPPPPMTKILALVHEWKNTICVHSKYKEDLVHIRDMHRLLGYKGYRFPDFDRRAGGVLNPSENLQTPEELEEADREAQAAKLQELIRRGTPKDLAAAQELMKIMSGFEPEKKPDYEKQVQNELDRIQQRILLLNEMLNNVKPEEHFTDGDAYYQIAHKCRQVQPKIQKWIEERAEEGSESIDRLLLMNDLINNIANRYDSFKKGNRDAIVELDPSFTAGGSVAQAKSTAKQVNLIDFDFDDDLPSSATPSQKPEKSGGFMDDLAELSSLSLGPTPEATTTTSASGSSSGYVDPMSFFNTSPSHAQIAAQPPITSQSGSFFNKPSSPAAAVQSSGGSFFNNPAFGNAKPGNSNTTWSSASSGEIRRTSTPLGAIQLSGSSTPSQKKPDPFEDLLA